LRFADAYWDQHREGVGKFLSDWNPRSKNLLLIGSSAGYSLPTDWLKGFELVTAYEPDPIARVIFEKRHGIRPCWIRTRFPFPDFSILETEANRGAAILFCNLMGQLQIRNAGEFRLKMLRHLKDREWASYHDALSGAGIEFDLEDLRPGRAGIREMEKWIYVKNRSRSEVAVNAHSAPEVFEGWTGLQYRYWQWRILPDFTHLIEGVFSSVR
jgi:hypothetical protein